MPTVLVTGANRGLGLGLVERYAARADHHVYATARDPSGARALHALAHKTERVTVVATDVADEGSIANLAGVLVADEAKLDVLINNAGLPGWQTLEEVDARTLEEVFAVNAFGPVLVTKALRPFLGTGSKIVNLTSVLGSIELAHGSGGIPYSMSKAALDMFTKQLAAQLRSAGIAVFALHPGWAQTRIGGRRARLTVDESADGMIAVIDAFDLIDSGSFLAYDGSRLPW